MPVSPVRRDYLIKCVFRLVSVLRRLDANPCDETDTVEIAVAGNSSRLLCGVALVVRPDTPRTLQDRTELGSADLGRLRVAWRGAANREQRPEFALGIGSVDYGELAVDPSELPSLDRRNQPPSPALPRTLKCTVARVPSGITSNERWASASLKFNIAVYSFVELLLGGETVNGLRSPGSTSFATSLPRCGSSISSSRPARSFAG